ncbi:MAG: type II toxin-antitoxin system RelE/ParE family toxin [Chloroflexota bacterium]|nr:type II toxin-antitoxin system RelE/ParE family toxin [Chloroflexota bacterium]MDE2686776.1 type II toxin-antitoxin system RelE/ParE family toxin [Chloroflexota bacterium]
MHAQIIAGGTRWRLLSKYRARLKGELTFSLIRGLWRYRAKDCRIVCDIQDDVLVVLVVRVGRRDGVYR